MKKFSIQKLGIGLFCATLIGIGGTSVLVNCKPMARTFLNTFQSTYKATPTIKGALQGVISGLDGAVSNNIYGEEQFINLYGLSERLLGRVYVNDTDAAYCVAKDNHKQLHFITHQTDNTKEVEQIAAVKDQVEAYGGHLLYVQTPLKVQDGYTKLPPSIKDYSTINTDTFLGALKEKEVDVLDLRVGVKEDGLDPSKLFFNTDHHWQTETAFWAVGKTVDTLNELYGLNLDPQGTYTDENNYRKVLYKQNFLGSQGRRVGKYFGGLDDYTLMLPNFDTSYSVTINKSDSSSIAEGTFEDAIVKYNLLNAKSVYTNRYAAYFGADFPEVIINNHKSDNGLKVLILKDSFALPFSAFFSTNVSETRMLDYRYYTNMTLEEYINDYKPDLVMYVYKSINTIK